MTDEERKAVQFDLDTAWAKGWVAHERDPDGKYLDLPAFFRAMHPKCETCLSYQEHPDTGYGYCTGIHKAHVLANHYCSEHTTLPTED